jgi:glycosyltransferase involved in cell wall biosynthesis
MNKISICIPVYNQASTIAETIESALAQFTKPYEIVVSENYSTDGTYKIVESYRDRIRIVRPPSHCSATDNFNFGISSCEGEWVGICSGDDTLLPQYIDAMRAGTCQGSNAVFVMGGWENFNEDTGDVIPHYLLSMKKVTPFPKSVQMQLLGTKASFAAFCFKKDAFEKVGGYNDNFKVIQDWIFQFDISKLGAVIKVDQLVARYRISNRPAIEAHRVPLYAIDRIHYLQNKIWEATDCGIPHSTVKNAAKQLLIELINYIYKNKIELDQQSINKLLEGARKAGALNEVEFWMAGKWEPQKDSWLSLLKRKSKEVMRISYNKIH